MTDVLVVSALKLGDPMVFGVDMVVDNLSLHAGRGSCTGAVVGAAPVR